MVSLFVGLGVDWIGLDWIVSIDRVWGKVLCVYL